MKRNLRKILAIAMTFLMISVLVAGCGTSQSPVAADSNGKTYTFKFAHEEIPGSVQDEYVQQFKKILEQKSNGRVKVEVYPVGQLGDATQQTELLQNGGLDFAIVSPGNTGTIVPENQLFSLHFLFSDNMDVNAKVMKDSKALNEDLSKLYLAKNIKVLAYWTEGFMDWTSNKQLNTPADFKGLKFRTMPSPMIVAAYKAYGANPTPVPYMEVYSGLQLNQIEGQENPLFAINEMKFYEVQKYLTLSNHDLYVTTTAINPQLWDSLPQDIKKMVQDTIDELRPFSFQIQQQLNDKALEQIKVNSAGKSTIVNLTPQQREAFKQASIQAKAKYIEMVGPQGKEILAKLTQEIEAVQKAAQ